MQIHRKKSIFTLAKDYMADTTHRVNELLIMLELIKFNCFHLIWTIVISFFSHLSLAFIQITSAWRFNIHYTQKEFIER